MFVLIVLPMCDATSMAEKEGAPTGMSPNTAENRQGPGIRERGTRVRWQEGAQETKGSPDKPGKRQSGMEKEGKGRKKLGEQCIQSLGKD